MRPSVKARIEAGLCRCGRPRAEERLSCQTCLDRLKTRRSQQKAKGLCCDCGKPAGIVRSRCDSCRIRFSSGGRLTKEEHDLLVWRQSGLCAICKLPEPMPGRQLAIDHCHKTNGVRGLLCGNCNLGLGHFKDSEPLLLAAIQYLNGPDLIYTTAKTKPSRSYKARKLHAS